MIAIDVTTTVGITAAQIAAAIQRGHERAMVEIAAELLRVAQSTIDTGIDPWGEPWIPHDQDTKPGRLGYRTGALRASLVATPTAPTPGVTSAEVRATAYYATFFHSRRPILPLTYDRGFTARGRRSRRRVNTVDLPPALLAKLVEIDTRYVLASLEEARTAARPTEV